LHSGKKEKIMRTDKFTVKSQEAIANAQQLAQQKGNQQVDVEHLLSVLLEEGIALEILKMLGTDIHALREELGAEMEKFPKVLGPSPVGQLYITQELKNVLDRAFAEAEHLQDDFVSVEHLLLGIVKTKGRTEQFLKKHGITSDKVLSAMREIRGSQRVSDTTPEDKYQALKRYARDLTDLAKKGRLDPVIGRDEEIRRIIQVLSRRTKNNPVVIGEPGVGKTALAEGLAQRITSGDVPQSLKDKRCSGRLRKPREGLSSLLTSSIPLLVQGLQRVQLMRPICSNLPLHGEISGVSGQLPFQSFGSILRRTLPLNVDSSRFFSRNRMSKIPYLYSGG
jgi:ATP-dependent Clp protease ATP-binding subunit ClpB